MLAVMVDLGWPWWVSTVVAATVAVAAALVFLRAREPWVRGVAAVLAVQGVAMAVAAPFLMSGSGGSTSMSAAPASAMGGPAPSGPRLTRAEFARRADANCRRLGRAAAGLGNPKTLPGVTRQLDAMMPMFWQAYGRQGLLVPPAGDEAATVRWLNAMAAVGSDLEETKRAASRGDAAGVRVAQTRASEHDKRVAQLSAQLGMQICS